MFLPSTPEFEARWQRLLISDAIRQQPRLPSAPLALAQKYAAKVGLLSQGLTRDRSLAGQTYLDKVDLNIAYLLYYGHLNLARVRAILSRGVIEGWWPEGPIARVADLGCGPGVASFALLDVLEACHQRGSLGPSKRISSQPHLPTELSLYAIDHSSAALSSFQHIHQEASRGGLWPHLTSTLEGVSGTLGGSGPLPPMGQDLILASYLFNELDSHPSHSRSQKGRGPSTGGSMGGSTGNTSSHRRHRARIRPPNPAPSQSEDGQSMSRSQEEWLDAVWERLAPGGTLLLIEPARAIHAQVLGQLRDHWANRPDTRVLSPCTHGRPCPLLEKNAPSDHGCHQETHWSRPRLIQAIDDRTGLNKKRLTFSHLALRKINPQPVKRDAALPEPMGSLDEPILPPTGPGHQHRPTTYRALGPALKSRGMVTVHLCGPTGFVSVQQLNRHRHPGNEVFADIARGDRVQIDGMERKGAVMRLTPESLVQKTGAATG